MDLFPTPEQELLVDTARDFTARTVTSDAVRALEAGDPGFDPDQLARRWSTSAGPSSRRSSSRSWSRRSGARRCRRRS